jgi:catechol 2,3-dioxygenase-like lactoylglutathione lyase family enzyme
MLQNNDIVAFIPTNDPVKAKAFYQDVLGLKFVSDDGFALVFEANGNMVRIARSGKFTPQQFTILGWQVKKIEDVVKRMSAKGVEFVNFPGLGQVASGIWIAPDGAAKVAWFKDPDGNTLSVSEHFK